MDDEELIPYPAPLELDLKTTFEDSEDEPVIVSEPVNIKNSDAGT